MPVLSKMVAISGGSITIRFQVNVDLDMAGVSHRRSDKHIKMTLMLQKMGESGGE